jgi:dTDP-4-amino-4,6-dideoxygalactose transaminase
MKIRFLNPVITEADTKAVVRVLRSGWLVQGPETKKFEQELAKYLGTTHVALTNSATSAMFLVLKSLGIGPGDEVITTPLTYVSTSNAILHCGATPVFVDVEPETGLIDVAQIKKAITKKTKAILPVHLYGHMADMKAIRTIAKTHKLKVVEDAAHAIESKRDGIGIGEASDAACFSFHVAKNITAGQGGAAATNYEALADSVRLMRRDGVANVGDKRRMTVLGYKMQLTEFQAALLTSQLARIDRQWAVRKKLWKGYVDRLSDMPGVSFQKTLPGTKHGYHMFVIWVEPKRRDAIRDALHAAGIETSIHYDPVHLEPYYKKRFGFTKGDFPITERLGAGTISMPLHLAMGDNELNYITRVLKKII